MEHTNVVNTVTHHNETVKTDVYVEARVFVGVKSCGTKYVWMRCTARHNFNPTNVLTYAAALTAANETAHINFKARLNEGEEACSHSDRNVLSEYLGKNTLNHYLTGGIGKVLINDKRFVLEECSFVSCVGGFVSVYTTGIYEAVRRLVGLHIANASAR